MDLLRTRQVDPVHQSPQTRVYGFFTHGTVPPPRLYSSGFLSLPDHLRRLPSPPPFRRRSLGPAAFVGQRGFSPAFGYGAPHSSARGTLTLLNNVLLSAHFRFADYSPRVMKSTLRV